MAFSRFHIPRLEGYLALLQDETGQVRLRGEQGINLEETLIGRNVVEAIYLTQQASTDSSISHALAAALALENASGIQVSHNGLLLRDLLHMFSLLHAHLRHFYFQVLPDYLPLAELGKYTGKSPELRRAAAGLTGKKAPWVKPAKPMGFTFSEKNRLLEHWAQALEAIALIQRMIAMIGGKFPVVMSVVPGGASVPFSENLIMKLKMYLDKVSQPLQENLNGDMALIAGKFPEIRKTGMGGGLFLSVGSLGDNAGPDAAFFSSGLVENKKLKTLENDFQESFNHSFYQIARQGGKSPLETSPNRPNAYSWIKTPTYGGKGADTGAFARLVVNYHSGARSHTADTVKKIESYTGVPLDQSNFTGARLWAMVGEVGPILKRCAEILGQFLPEDSSHSGVQNLTKISGEGAGWVEAPAGTLIHKVVVEKGRIVFYDIVAPGTWNGAPGGEGENAGGVEKALNAFKPNLRTNKGLLEASRIIHSYFLSASDAVH